MNWNKIDIELEKQKTNLERPDSALKMNRKLQNNRCEKHFEGRKILGPSKKSPPLPTAARWEIVHEVTLSNRFYRNRYSYQRYPTKSITCPYWRQIIISKSTEGLHTFDVEVLRSANYSQFLVTWSLKSVTWLSSPYLAGQNPHLNELLLLILPHSMTMVLWKSFTLRLTKSRNSM